MTDPPVTILIVEDNPDFMTILRDSFREAGFDVLSAPNGTAGLALVADPRVGVALVDLLLPGASGFQVLQSLRHNRGDDLPVVVMSGNDSPAHKNYAASLGASAFLPKPFLAAEAVEVVTTLLAAV